MITDCVGETLPLPGEPMKVDHVEATHDYSVTQTTKDGRQVWRFEVRDGDVLPWDQENVSPEGKPNERAEVSYAPAEDSEKRHSRYNATPESGVKTYTIGVKFGEEWPNDQRWASLMSFHPQDTPGVWGFSGIYVHDDRIDIAKPFIPYGQDIWSAKIEPGKWYDIQLQVKWSTGNDGFVKVKVNGNEAGSYQGKTIAPGESYYVKQGYYRDGAVDRTGVVYETPITILESGRVPLPGKPMKVDHVEATHDYSVKQIAKDGRQVWRFEVRDGDVQPWDQHNVGPGGKPNQRAEISYAAAADSEKRNSPYNATPESGLKTYSIGFNFEEGWPHDHLWATLMQFHPQESRAWGFSGIALHHDRIEIPKPFTEDQHICSVKIEPGKWYDFQLQVNWSTGDDGWAKVMVNGKEVGSYQGETISRGESYYIKQGYYRDGSIEQTGVVYQTSIIVS